MSKEMDEIMVMDMFIREIAVQATIKQTVGLDDKAEFGRKLLWVKETLDEAIETINSVTNTTDTTEIPVMAKHLLFLAKKLTEEN